NSNRSSRRRSAKTMAVRCQSWRKSLGLSIAPIYEVNEQPHLDSSRREEYSEFAGVNNRWCRVHVRRHCKIIEATSFEPARALPPCDRFPVQNAALSRALDRPKRLRGVFSARCQCVPGQTQTRLGGPNAICTPVIHLP